MLKTLALVLAILSCPELFAQRSPVMKALQKDLPSNTVFYLLPACGLGSFMFPDYSWFSLTPASTTNIVFSPSAPTSTTMNTSECKGPKSLVDRDNPLEIYVDQQLPNIAKDIASGDGVHLKELARLLKVSEDDYQLWVATLRIKFNVIFQLTNSSAVDVLDKISAITIDKAAVKKQAIISNDPDKL